MERAAEDKKKAERGTKIIRTKKTYISKKRERKRRRGYKKSRKRNPQMKGMAKDAGKEEITRNNEGRRQTELAKGERWMGKKMGTSKKNKVNSER